MKTFAIYHIAFESHQNLNSFRFHFKFGKFQTQKLFSEVFFQFYQLNYSLKGGIDVKRQNQIA